MFEAVSQEHSDFKEEPEVHCHFCIQNVNMNEYDNDGWERDDIFGDGLSQSATQTKYTAGSPQLMTFVAT